jgi:DNA-repair protein XRCC2
MHLRALEGRNDASFPGFPTLDRLFRVHEASTHDLNRAQNAHHSQPIIEFCSEESGTGKTHLLYLIITVAILPQFYADVTLDGKNSAIILLDTGGNFSIQRLVEIMQDYITTRSSEILNIAELIANSLQHVHIFQPQTMESFLETLSSLHNYINKQTYQSSQLPVHSIIIDGASTFYWQGRAEQDTAQVDSLHQHPGGPSLPRPNSYNGLIQSLRKLSETFCCAIIVTTHAFTFTKSEPGSSILRTLPSPWSSFPTTRLLLTREPVRKFARGMSIEEALKEQAGRQTVVEKAMFRANLIGSGDAFFFSIQKNRVIIEAHR